MEFSLTALMDAAKAAGNLRSNSPSVRDLEAMRDAFSEWKIIFGKNAKEARERCAKLELIGDKDAYWERHKRDSAEADAAKCDVGIRVLNWAISALRGIS